MILLSEAPHEGFVFSQKLTSIIYRHNTSHCYATPMSFIFDETLFNEHD
jgi:hypothetical protein